MKYRNLVFSAALSLVCLVSVAVHAATLNIEGLGTLSPSMSGTTIGTSNNLDFALPNADLVYGKLAPNSEITFTYTLTGTLGTTLSSGGLYNANNYLLSANASSLGGTSYTSQYDGTTIGQLVFATADLALGKTTVTNLSSFYIDFASLVLGWMSPKGSTQASWQVSAVPLPAALPLFGAGLLGLAGIGRFRKSRKNA